LTARPRRTDQTDHFGLARLDHALVNAAGVVGRVPVDHLWAGPSGKAEVVDMAGFDLGSQASSQKTLIPTL